MSKVWWPSFENIMERVTINPMTAEQAATLKRLAEAAYDLAAFKPSSRMTRRMSVSRY
jgi:hypothetical protein